MLVYFLPAGLSEGKYDIDAEENRARLGSAEEENEADRAGGGCVRFFDNFRRGIAIPSPLASGGLGFSGDIFSGEETSSADPCASGTSCPSLDGEPERKRLIPETCPLLHERGIEDADVDGSAR